MVDLINHVTATEARVARLRRMVDLQAFVLLLVGLTLIADSAAEPWGVATVLQFIAGVFCVVGAVCSWAARR